MNWVFVHAYVDESMVETSMFRGGFVCSWLDVKWICCLSARFVNQTFIMVTFPVQFQAIFMVLQQI
jgi:hypothetical protein